MTEAKTILTRAFMAISNKFYKSGTHTQGDQMKLLTAICLIFTSSIAYSEINSIDPVKDPMSKTITDSKGQVIVDLANPNQQITLESNDIKMISIFDHNHITFDLVLKKYVKPVGNTTQVDYKALKKNINELVEYLTELEVVTKKEFKAWTKDQQFAYWVNAYNAYTLKIVADNYPVDSIRDIGGPINTTWKKKFIPILGKKRSLDEIEHKILRRQFKEPRIHFAVNCASISCPALKTEPYIAAKLNDQLNEQTKIYINDPINNKYTINGNKLSLEISEIFKWFKEDFKTEGGSGAFVLKWLDLSPETKASINSSNISVKHIKYNWGLNESK